MYCSYGFIHVNVNLEASEAKCQHTHTWELSAHTGRKACGHGAQQVGFSRQQLMGSLSYANYCAVIDH